MIFQKALFLTVFPILVTLQDDYCFGCNDRDFTNDMIDSKF